MAPATANQELRPSANSVVKDPLLGILPRKVTAKQVLPVMASSSTCPYLPSPSHIDVTDGKSKSF
jgi:hypothetical protein